MQPGLYTLDIQQGASLELDIAWRPDGVLADLTGYTARWQIRASADGALLLEANTDNGGLTLGEYTSAGRQFNVRLALTPAAAAGITNNAVHELWLYQGETFATPVLEGAVRLNRSIIND